MILLAAATGIAGFWLGRTTSRSSDYQTRPAQLERENTALKASIEKLHPSPASPDDTRAPVQTPSAGSHSRVPLKREPPYSDDAEAVRTLHKSLASANQSIADWQSRAEQLEAQLDEAKEDQKRLAAVESDLAAQVAASKRLAETKEAELSRKSEQLVTLEAANKKLAGDAGNAGQKANQLLHTADELQEIYRRRESYLNTLISRYREVTEQYRAFASVLENRRGPEGASNPGTTIAGPELARIQNSIAMAEEDLRQLNNLNAQALRVQKKLSVK
jgi:DNA repair exonuclease SbcCD ATPase subunit